MKVYYVTQVLKQRINIKTMRPNYTPKFRNLKSHILKVYLGDWFKIDIVIKKSINIL